jgi:ankyrin repeat protein
LRASVSVPPAAEVGTKAAAEAPAGALGSQTPIRPIQAPALPALAAMAPPVQPGTLLAAAAAGDIEAVRRLLQTRGPDEERDADGRTALALAVLRSDVRLVRLLLDKGANRLAPDRLGQTPLGHAQAGGDAALLRALGAP